jgi:hypothetical protein
MRTLLVGDVHGCSRELRALLDLARPDRVLLAGDAFTKGPDPLGVFALVRETGARSVLGNHDLWLLRALSGTLSPASKPTRMPLLDEAASTPGFVALLRALPLFLEEPDFLLVHAGIHPFGGIAHTTPEMALTLRRWPDDDDEHAPFWWELLDPEAERRLVVHAHDARRGLVDRRPRNLGLDGGCVYGGSLFGYLVEDDTLLEVPAFDVYRDVGRRRGS